jgi:hypothetical protein
MSDPLSPIAGVLPRLAIAIVLCALIWLGTFWAMS